jgi:amino acid permease
MYLSGVAYCTVLIIFVPLHNIANSEMLEGYQWVSKLILDKDGEKSRPKLVLFRLMCFAVFSILALITEDVTVVFNLVGGLAVPYLSFYLPFFLNFMYDKIKKRKRNIFSKLNDILLILAGFFIQGLILHYVISVQLIKGDDHDIEF